MVQIGVLKEIFHFKICYILYFVVIQNHFWNLPDNFILIYTYHHSHTYIIVKNKTRYLVGQTIWLKLPNLLRKRQRKRERRESERERQRESEREREREKEREREREIEREERERDVDKLSTINHLH